MGLEISDLFPKPSRSDRYRPGNRIAGFYYLVVDEDAAEKLLELRRKGFPALALPPSTDPSWFRWPVKGRDIKILGRLSAHDLLLTASALRRDGCKQVLGEDMNGELHVFGASDERA